MVGSSCFFTNKVKDLLENNHYLSFGGKKWRITIKTKEQEPTGLGNYFVHYLVGYFCCYGPIFYDAGRKRF